MNKSDIQKTEAGPVLNTIIGTKIMGIKTEWSKRSPCPYCGDPMYGGGDHHRAYCTACGEWRYGPHKCYSACMEDAWEPIEKLTDEEDLGFTLQVVPQLDESKPTIYQARMGCGPWFIAATMPLAICRMLLDYIHSIED